MIKKGFSVLAEADDNVTVYVYGGINTYDEEGYIVFSGDFIKEIEAIKTDKMDVRIASIGGDPMGAADMYQALVSHSAKVRTIVDNKALSAGSMLLQAGDERIATALSMIMVHGPASKLSKGRGTPADHRETAAIIEAHEDAMVKAYSRHGIKEEKIRNWFNSKEDVYFAAEAALEENLIDTIEDSIALAASAPENYRIAAMGGSNHAAKGSTTTQEIADMAEKDKNLGASGASKDTNLVTQHNKTVSAAQTEGAKLEAARRLVIDETFQGFYTGDPLDSVTAVYDACVADIECDELQARRALQACLAGQSKEPILSPNTYGMQAKTSPPPGFSAHLGGGVQMISDHVDKQNEGMELALMVKSGLMQDQKLRSEAERGGFMALSLIEMGVMSMQNIGIDLRGAGGDKMQLAYKILASHTTSDFPNVLANIASKAAMIGYNEAGETWQEWCKVGNLTDFKQAKRVTTTAFPDLDKIPASGEYKFAQLSDVGESILLATYGKKFRITRHALINDDMNAFTDIPRKMGRAAARTPGNLAYAVLIANAALEQDGVVLFHVDHVNLAAVGAPPSIATLDDGFTSMALQTDPDDNVVAMNLEPQFLIVPRKLRTAGRTIVASEKDPTYDADNPGTPANPFYNELTVVSDARLDKDSVTSWYLAAAPNQADTIEVAFLNGQQNPVVDQMEMQSPDGRDYYVRLDCAAAALGYQGLYKNPGV